MNTSAVVGLDSVLRNIAAKGTEYPKRVERGLVKGGVFILRESQDHVPVLTGYLRRSGEMTVQRAGIDTTVTIRYGANYALFVHENLDARHKPGKTAKFLENAVRNNIQTIRNIIRQGAMGA